MRPLRSSIFSGLAVSNKINIIFRSMNSSNQSKQENFDKTNHQASQPKRKSQGNSQFVKSRFDKDYNPKLRVFKSLSAYSSSFEKKRKIEASRNEELAALINKTQEEIKQGNKIIIDWSHKNNFRTTRFPAIDSRFDFSKRAKTEEIAVASLDTPKNAKYYQYLTRFENNSFFKEIATKGQLLRDLLSESTLQKRRLKKRNIKRLIGVNDQKDLSSSQEFIDSQNHDRKIDEKNHYGSIKEVQQRQRQFFASNQNKIQKAIDYEKHLQDPSISKNQNRGQQKSKIQQIHERIICKSKLALLKSDLAKKFKQIREGVLEQSTKLCSNGQALH